ncbi:hypothetical protein [Arenimonas malthae]|uniref:hypothetical protein n=1 Tax=Arenimonas malthae TaxID=354197 RepID=UPI0005C1B80F|nr:hypothetical protein [Arenimonas malthae]
MQIQSKVPVWFTVLAVLALLWNLVGCLAVAADLVVVATGAVGQLPADQQALYAARPAWAVVGSVVAVLAGLAGSLGLLMRRRWAMPLLLASLAGLVLQDLGFVLMARSVELPAMALGMQALVAAIAVGLVLLARLAGRRGWLR